MSPRLRHYWLFRLQRPVGNACPNFSGYWRTVGFIVADNGGHRWASGWGNATMRPMMVDISMFFQWLKSSLGFRYHLRETSAL